MIAEVGGIVNVSGSRIAMPFAPPRPGSTPMMTPRLDADEHQQQVERRQRDREAVKQCCDVFQLVSRPGR